MAQQQQQQQQQPPQVDPQLPGPTEEELRDYKLGMERATAQFHEQVQATGTQAYINLIHTLKITSLKLITDLMDAEEDKVLQLICRTDGHHFMTGFTIHTRASTSRTYDPEFSTEDFDDTTNKLICELHLEAVEVCEKMSKIHTYIACLKTRVSPRDFLTITSSVGLPLTTITTVDPAKQSKLDSNVDALRIHDHMPDPSNVFGNEATKQLAALVRYWMQNYLLTTQWQYSLVACENDFKLGRTKFERVVSGKKRGGGHEYGKKRKLRPDEQPTGADKPKKKRENPVYRGQVKTGVGCRLAPNCRQTFNNIKELGIHSRQAHWKMFPFRCNYKDCFDCYRTIDALVKHCRSHGKETWDATHSTEDKKDRYKCSLCPETFDQVAQLLSHTQVHEENKYKCDECEWHFYLIAGLTCHGQDCHDTRYHACSWCVEYFDNPDTLHTHIRHKHHFECTICYDVSPTAEDLEEHIKEKHGGLQPGEQELQTQRHREERLEQSERRKEKAEAEARQTMYFPCKECVEGFNTKRELDKHITDKHIFICSECLKTFKTKEERDMHMKTDHKDVSN